MTEDTSSPSLSDQPEAVDPDGNAHRPNQQSAVMAEISLAHLHPGIRHITLADDSVRLQAMRATRIPEQTVGHVGGRSEFGVIRQF